MEKEKEKELLLTENSRKFIGNFLQGKQDSQRYLSKKDNERIINTALVYEKLRVAVEYQEEHLVFKNAISRIIRRKYTLNPNIIADQLLNGLISELSWADYVNPETIADETWDKIKVIIERYLALLKSGRSGRFSNRELHKKIIDWLACEIDDVMKPKRENEFFINYVYSILSKSLNLGGTKISEEENELELKLTIFSLALKPDYPMVEFWLLRHVYPGWLNFSPEEMKKFGRSFDPYYNKVDRLLNHPLHFRYTQFVKRNISPFLVLRSTLLVNNLSQEKIYEQPARLHSACMDSYAEMIKAVRKKVTQATIRALVFIFLSKITLAFILEIPFDHLWAGEINYLSLIVNVSLPPALMFISGISLKSPSKKNEKFVSRAISDILFDRKIEGRVFDLVQPSQGRSFYIFNAFYSLISLGILGGALWMLIYLKFNIISIILFFLFVSIVSFFAFRIRNMALELAIKRSRDNTLTAAVELMFLPFIRVGRVLSNQFANFNPFILFLDFMIEAPLKTIIRIVNSWFRFINAKKEEIEF